MFGRSLKSLVNSLQYCFCFMFVCLFVCLSFGLESSDILINLFYFILSSYCSDSQSCPNLCDQWTVCSLPASSIHAILPARILEGVAIPSSRGSSQPRDRTRISCVSYIGRQIVYHHTTWEETPEIFTDRILWETNNTINLLIVG